MTFVRIGIYINELMGDTFQEVAHMTMTHNITSKEELQEEVEDQVKKFIGMFTMVKKDDKNE